MDHVCTCRESISAEEAVQLIAPDGRLAAVYDKRCPVHGYAVVSDVQVPEEEMRRRVEAGEFNHIYRSGVRKPI